MIYTIIISLLIEKPLYLLRPQSLSFQIVSEFIDTFVKFSNFMSQGWGFWFPVLSRGEGFVHNDCPGGRVFAPFKSCPRGDGFGWNWYLHYRKCAANWSVPVRDRAERGRGLLAGKRNHSKFPVRVNSPLLCQEDRWANWVDSSSAFSEL